MIELRALTTADLEKTVKWHNQDEIRNLYLGHPFPINKETEEQWYAKILTSNIPTTVFGIQHIADDKLIGITVLKNINLINRSAEFAMYIGDQAYRGKGLSTLSTRKTLSFGFQQLNLNRISLNVLATNEKAIGLYQKLGFVQEGELRKSIFKNGEYHNEYIFSLLKSDFNHEV